MKLEIKQGNVFDKIKEVPDNSIDLCITSPPYWGLRDYGIDGQLGNEPTMEKYLDNTLIWVKEVFRVLKPTGSFVLNLGDCFIGGGRGGGHANGFVSGHVGTAKAPSWNDLKKNGTADWKANSTPNSDGVGNLGGIYKTKQLLSITSFAYCKIVSETDFVCRGEHIWCLEENTRLILKRAGYKIHTTIKEAWENGAQEILTPDQQGKIEWTRINGIYNVGKKECLKITLTNGLSVVCSEDHIFPVKGCQLHKNEPPYLQLKNKKAKDIRIGQYLIVAKKFQNPHSGDEEDGFALGFYLAEGNLYLDKRKGNTIPTVMFSCHFEKDRQHIDRLKAKFNIKEYNYGEAETHLRSRDRRLIKLIESCVEGRTSKDKHLKQIIFSSTSAEFMRGVILGFCAGDGYYRKGDRFPSFRIGITDNEKLMDDLMVLCRFIGWDFRYQGKIKVKLNNGKEYPSIRFAIFPSRERHRFGDLEVHKIRSIEKVGDKQCYDLEIEQKYPNHRSGKAWNSLFCLANGIITHNCKPNVPSPIRSRLKHSHEKLFWFVKDADKYYFDQKPWMKKVQESSNKQYENATSDSPHCENIKLSPTSCYRAGKGKEYLKNQDTIEHSWRIIPVGAKGSGFEMEDGKPVSEHIAPFPENLIRPYIQSLCPQEGTILDTFLGSGTTMRLALENQRNCIGIELNEKYIEYAKKRLNWGQAIGVDYGN